MKKIILIATFISANAFANSHDFYNKARSADLTRVYLGAQAQYANAVMTTEYGNSDKWSGNALQLSAGFEHFKFLQTGLLYNQVSVKQDSLTVMSTNEYGAEGRVILSSPVINIGLSGAALLSSGALNSGTSHTSLNGRGIKLGVEAIYWASPRINLIVTAGQTNMNYAMDSNTSVSSKQMRAGLGIAIRL